MPNGQPNIPQTGQKTVRAFMRVKSFVSPENPIAEQLVKYDKEINDFLQTIDNQKRFLNGRNSYSVGNRIYTLIWYLERIPEKPVSKPFGEKVKEAKPVVEEKKDDKPAEAKENQTG